MTSSLAYGRGRIRLARPTSSGVVRSANNPTCARSSGSARVDEAMTRRPPPRVESLCVVGVLMNNLPLGLAPRLRQDGRQRHPRFHGMHTFRTRNLLESQPDRNCPAARVSQRTSKNTGAQRSCRNPRRLFFLASSALFAKGVRQMVVGSKNSTQVES